MAQVIKKLGVDISIPPSPPEEKGEPARAYSMGDAHGNTLLVLWHVIHSGAVALDDKSYQDFADIYKRLANTRPPEQLNPVTLEQIEEIFHKLSLKNPKVLLRFLGDLIGDRGANDLLTLMLLDRLEELGVEVRCLVSNHDMYFISAYESARRACELGQGSFINCLENCLRESHGKDFPSGKNFLNAVKNGIITEKKFHQLIARHKARLKAIDYSREEGELCIYTHAPVGVEAIRFYANYFGIEYTAASQQELVDTISAVNIAFKKAVEERDPCIMDYNKDYNRLKALPADQSQGAAIAAQHPLIYACEALAKPSEAAGKLPVDNNSLIEIPDNVSIVHGHTPLAETFPLRSRFISLDGSLGRPGRWKDEALFYPNSGDNSSEPSAEALEKITQAKSRFNQHLGLVSGQVTEITKNSQRAKVMAGITIPAASISLVTLLARTYLPKEILEKGFRETVPGLFNNNAKSMAVSSIVVFMCVLAIVALLWNASQDRKKQQAESAKSSAEGQAKLYDIIPNTPSPG